MSLSKEQANNIIVPILNKYNFQGRVVLFGTYPSDDEVKIACDPTDAKNGIDEGMAMFNELKKSMPKGITLTITSLIAVELQTSKVSHPKLVEEFNKGVLIYGKAVNL